MYAEITRRAGFQTVRYRRTTCRRRGI
jgi:hypothetical protein